MKRIISILIITILTLLFVSGCTDSSGYNRNKNYYIKINSIDNFITLMESDEINTIVVSQTICSYCDDYKKVINKIAFEEDIDIYVIEYDTLKEKDKDKFREQNERLNDFGTPLTIFTQNNEIIDEINGNTTAAVVIAKLTNLGLI